MRSRVRRTLIFCGVAGVLASPALAQTNLPPTLRKLDISEACQKPDGPVSRYIFARTIVKAYKVSLEFIDWSDTGIGYDQYRQAVSTYLCSGPLTPAQEKKCYGPPDKVSIGPGGTPQLTADGAAQVLMVGDVDQALASGASKGPDFDLKFGDTTLQFHRHPASNLDIKKQSVLDNAPKGSLAGQVFSESPKFFDVTCKSKQKQQTPSAASLPPNEKSRAAAASFPDQVRIRAKAR